MANTIAGLFADPNSFRDQRIKDLMQQRQAIGRMGGSMSDLLGQVAAGGGATGAMMAEAAGGLFGMKTAEEAKAADIQNLFDETVAMSDGEFNLDTSENLNYFAKKLNDLGYTKEAVLMLEKAQERLQQETALADAATKRAQGVPPRVEERTVPVLRTYKGKPVLDENGDKVYDLKTIKTYRDFNPETGKWEERKSNQDTGTGEEGAQFHNLDSFNEALRKKYGY